MTNGSTESAQTAGIQCLNIKELAIILGVSVRHVERMDAAGKLPKPLRLGRAKRWRYEEIKSWLAAGCPERQQLRIVKAAV
jgi:excisionase family DNA binding protein